jgi:antitoxin component YwqK of YwqJK toxin-antitoxin module
MSGTHHNMHYFLTHPLRSPLLAALLLSASAASFAVQDCELNGKSINTNNGNETAGKNGMVRCKDRDTGLTEREYELRNGDSVGLSRYFRKGQLYKEFTITANGPHEGLEREWAANGQLISEFTNVNGNVRGLRRQWYDDGAPKSVEFVAENEREGAAAQFNPNRQLYSLRCGPKPLLAPHVNDAALCGFTGGPNTLSTYGNDGKLRGTTVLLAGQMQKATVWYSNGKPQEEYERQGDKRLERFYDDEGPKRREKVWLDSERPAVLLRDAEFHTSGTLVRERLYVAVDVNGRKRGRLSSDARFYLNGQAQSKDSYSLDGTAEQRDTQRYSDKGTLRYKGRYVQDGRYGDRAVGVHQSFFDDGKLAQEEHFDDKGNVKRQRVWDETGKLLSDDELFEDGSRKAYAR